MLTTWIESPVKGRLAGPVRAGMWSAVVVGTHPIEADQQVSVEVLVNDVLLGLLPGYWVENKGANSLWHVPIPPQAVNARIRYRAVALRPPAESVLSPFQETVVRPNVPAKDESPSEAVHGPEGLIGNRMMSVRIDERGATFDVLFPTVGLHSEVRPRSGDQPQSRTHFRAIVGGIAAGQRIEWFCERHSWEVFQHYRGATNLLVTELKSRRAPIRVTTTDFVAVGSDLPRTAGGAVSPGQCFKRFRIHNDGDEPLHQVTFAVYVHAEVNGGVGDPGLSWYDGDRCLVATNRGHGHANRKLARDATIEFALAFDDHGPVHCEPVGPLEAILLRPLDLPAGGSVPVDLLLSGAFTGWRGDTGTFDHWLRTSLNWFRMIDLDQVEQATEASWDEFIEPLPTLRFPRSSYGVVLRRSALAAALHADADWGAIASGYELGLRAYCWPREAVWVSGALDRLGHTAIGRKAFEWLNRVRHKNRPYLYWFQKYTVDGWPEWETPAIDQSAVIPWGLERYYRRTGDRAYLAACWPMIEEAVAACKGQAGHPGLRWLEDLRLVTSSGVWEGGFGAFQYANVSVVAGLRAAARLAEALGKPEPAAEWEALARTIWQVGILQEVGPDDSGPGLVDADTGRFLEGRRLSRSRDLWTDKPSLLRDTSRGLDILMLGIAVPFGLLPASDPRVRATADALLTHNVLDGDPNALARWRPAPTSPGGIPSPEEGFQLRPSSLASLWMARYLIQLGRETGEPAQWTRALALLDDVIGRLCPLGLGLRLNEQQFDDPSESRRELPGVWDLHAMLVETILDLAGLDYDVPARALILDPVLPVGWPQIGIDQTFACGRVGYRLERTPGTGSYRLSVEAALNIPVKLQLGVTCPGLSDPGTWRSRTESTPPRFEPHSHRLTWVVELPNGHSTWEWAWG